MPTPRSRQTAGAKSGKLAEFDRFWTISDISKLYHDGNGAVSYVGTSSLQEEDIGTIRSINPVPLGTSILVSILDPGSKCYIAAGFCHKDYPDTLLPGWARTSIGFHGDSGNIFINSSDGVPFGRPCVTNDCIECVLLPAASERSVIVVFRHNGRELGSRELVVPDGGFYAIVGLMTPGEKVHLSVVENFSEPSSSYPADSCSAQPLSLLSTKIVKGATKQVLFQSNLDYDPRQKLFKSMSSSSGPGYIMFQPSLSRRLCYFEVEVVHLDQDNETAIGLAVQDYPSNALPGTSKGSVAIHCNGVVKCDGVTVLSTVPIHSGDVIGCLVNVTHKFEFSSTPKEIPLTFYKNAKQIAATSTGAITGSLHPIIGTSGGKVEFIVHYRVGRKPSDFFKYYPLPNGYQNIDVDHEIDPSWVTSLGQHVEDNVFTTVGHGQPCTAVAVYKVPLTLLDHYYTVTLRQRNNEFAEFSIGLTLLPTNAVDISVASVQRNILFCPIVGIVKKDHSNVYNFTPNVWDSLVRSSNFGVGIDPRSKNNGHIDVFFTCDNQEVYRTNISCSRDEALYPMITSKCASTDEAFQVDIPAWWPPPMQLGEPWGICRVSPRCAAAYNSLVAYSGDSNTDEVGAIQAAFPLTPHHRYFELRVYKRGGEEHPRIGIGVAERDYALDMQPGWRDGSIAYHLDDGNIFHNSAHDNVGLLCTNDGDIFGCGLVYPTNPSSPYVIVFFTKNSQLIACEMTHVPTCGFFPTIGMHTAASMVDIDLNAALVVDVPQFPYEWQAVQGVKVTGNVLTLTGKNQRGSVEFAPSTKVRYFKIRHPSKKEAVTMKLGFKTVSANSSEITQVCLQTPKNNVLFNTSIIANIPVDSSTVDYIGCGIASSQCSSVVESSARFFITANDFLIYSLDTCEFSAEDVVPVVEIKAQPGYRMKLNAHSLWPPVTVIGRGWAKVHNLSLQHNNHISTYGNSFGYAQAARSLSEDNPYFEVEIVEHGHTSNIAVGLANMYYNHWPGFQPVSIAYHINTGCIHCSSEKSSKKVCKLYAGDVVGCGVRVVCGSLERLAQEKNKGYEIYFAVNGQVVYAKDATDVYHPSLLYPTFALGDNYDAVVVHLNVNFPSFSLGREWRYFRSINKSGFLYEHSASPKMKVVEPGVMQARTPLSEQNCYFSMTIVDIAFSASIGVSPKMADSTTIIGMGGIMYSSSGQLILHYTGTKRIMPLERCALGDTMSCRVEFENSVLSAVEFYHNEMMIYSQRLSSNIAGHPYLYATFSIERPGDVVKINFNPMEPSCFISEAIGWSRTSNVLIKNDIIMFTGKRNAKNLPIGFAQVAQIVDGESLSYYEVEILQTGQRCRISVGLATPSYPLDSHPGWYVDSIAFHGDDGKLFNAVGTGVPFCHPWKKGDIVGVGVRNLNLDKREDVDCCAEESQVFFTRNGTEIGCTTAKIPFAKFYPTIGMHSIGECVKIDVKAPPPMVHSVQRSHWRVLSGVKMTNVSDQETTFEYDHPLYVPSSPLMIATAVSARPFSAHCKYAEITIHSLGDVNAVIIGAVEKGYPLGSAPGWNPGSIAYHSDDGKLFKNGQATRFGPICHAGDVMGIRYHCASCSECSMVFLQNGTEVGREQIALPQSGFFPVIGLVSPGDKVTIRFQESANISHSVSSLKLLSPMRISNIMFSGHVLTYDSQQANNAVGMAVFSIPIGEKFEGFSVNVINQTSNVYVGIVSRDYPLHTAPGKKSLSCAYNTLSGLLCECLDNTGTLRTYRCQSLSTGDTLGCKIEPHSEDENLNCLLFTWNRKKVASITLNKSIKRTPLYPAVAVLHVNSRDSSINDPTCLYIDSNPRNYLPMNDF
ncbi:uncharacterized protein [Dysidea avara]|uniref:uncharacterized protein n=1 Tax=Dysidea avara TaxID=196820 RepID=UPI003322FDBD